MSKQEIYSSAIDVATIHADRIKFAIEKLAILGQLNASKVIDLDVQNLLYLELFTNRFSKLQDYMGSVLFDMCLEELGDVTDGLTMIDKVNKLVKYNIIASEELWREFRKARNHLSHEYPTRPDLTALYINATLALAPKLIDCYENIKKILVRK